MCLGEGGRAPEDRDENREDVEQRLQRKDGREASRFECVGEDFSKPEAVSDDCGRARWQDDKWQSARAETQREDEAHRERCGYEAASAALPFNFPDVFTSPGSDII